jgi:hypothetical protein
MEETGGHMMKVLAEVAELWLSSLFAYSAALKLVRHRGAPTTLAQYKLLPSGLLAPLGYGLPWIELSVATAILVPATSRAGAAGAAVFGLAVAVLAFDALSRRTDVPCGCTGATHDRITTVTVVRGLVIAGTGAFVISYGAPALGVGIILTVTIASLVPAALLALRLTNARRGLRRVAAERDANLALAHALLSSEMK